MESFYIGLEPYSEEQADNFLGRETEVTRLTNSIKASRLTVIYGEAKVGKSSLLRAGVMPQLKKEAENNISIAKAAGLDQDSIKPISWPVYIDCQGKEKHIITLCEYVNTLGLINALLDVIYEKLNESHLDLTPAPKLSDQDGFERMTEVLGSWANTLGLKDIAGSIHIIVDHAELASLGYQEGTSLMQDIIIPIINCQNLPVNFLLSFRSSSVILLDRFRDQCDFLANRFEIMPLEKAVVNSSILPAFLAGLCVDQSPGSSEKQDHQLGIRVLEELGENVTDKIEHYQSRTRTQGFARAYQDKVRPTYLQLIFSSIQGSEPDALERLKTIDMGKIVNSFIQSEFAKYSSDEQILAAFICKFLTRSSSFGETTTSLGDLCSLIFNDRFYLESTSLDPSIISEIQNRNTAAKIQPVLDKLSNDSRLLTSFPTSSGVGYEIHFDFLSPMLRWVDKTLSGEAQYKASRATEIACQSIINRLRMTLSLERDMTNVDLIGLLALQAYSFSKYANAETKSKIFSDAFREFLNFPYSSQVLAEGGEGKVEVAAVTLSADSQTIAFVDFHGSITIIRGNFLNRDWRLSKTETVTIQSENGCGTSIAFHPKRNDIFVVGYRNGSVDLGRIETEQLTCSLQQCKKPIEHYAGDRPDHGSGPGPIAFKDDGTWLAFASLDNKVTLWKLTDDYDLKLSFDGDIQLTNIRSCEDWIWAIAFGHHNNKMVLGCRNGNLLVFDLEKIVGGDPATFMQPRLIRLPLILGVSSPEPPENSHHSKDESKKRPFEIFSVAYRPDDQLLAVGTRGLVCLFDPNFEQDNPTENENHPISRYSRAQEQGIRSLAFDNEGKYLCFGSDDIISNSNTPGTINDQTLRLWDLQNRDSPAIILSATTSHTLGINSVVYSKSNKFIVSSSWDGTVRLWYLQPDRPEPLLFSEHSGPARAVSWSPDGQWLASATWDANNSIYLQRADWLWPNQATMKPAGSPIHLPATFYGNCSLAFSPDSKFLACGGYHGDNRVRIWNVEQPHQTPQALEGHSGEVRAVAFGSDFLASGAWDRSVKLWTLNNLELPPITLADFPGAIRSLAFSSNHQWLAVGTGTPLNGYHSTMYLLDMLTIRNCCTPGDRRPASFAFTPLPEPVLDQTFGVAFSPNSNYLASVGRDNQLHFWQLTSGGASKLFQINQMQDLEDFAGSSIAFSAKGTMLAVGCWSTKEDDTEKQGSVWIWYVDRLISEGARCRPNVLKIPREYMYTGIGRDQYHVTSIAFSPGTKNSDSQFLAFGSNDWTTRIWTIKTGMLAKLAASQVTRNMTDEEWNTYIDKGANLTPRENIFPPDYFPGSRKEFSQELKGSRLVELLNVVDAPPFAP